MRLQPLVKTCQEGEPDTVLLDVTRRRMVRSRSCMCTAEHFWLPTIAECQPCGSSVMNAGLCQISAYLWDGAKRGNNGDNDCRDKLEEQDEPV